MIILGIETSCDETACGIVEIDEKQNITLLSNVVFSSMDLHKVYGGVVPEIAARSHIESIIPVIEQALHEASDGYPPPINDGLMISDERLSSNGKMLNDKSMKNAKRQWKNALDPWSKVDAIAVTYGAGLGGSLLVGVMTARTLAIVKNKPLYAVNHVHGHVAVNFITSASEQLAASYQLPSLAPQFPLLALIVSGGHTQLVLFKNHFVYQLLGRTQDDAIGEAFDKVAKIIGLPYPGGPSISAAALNGNPKKYKLPKSKLDGKYDFSFSGLKTAVLRLAQEQIGEDFTFPSHLIAERLHVSQKADIAASFQRVAIETIVDKSLLACEEFSPKSIVIAGGVAANDELRKQLSDRLPFPPIYSDIKLCTDNGAMIAALGALMAVNNQPTANPYKLEIQPNLSM